MHFTIRNSLVFIVFAGCNAVAEPHDPLANGIAGDVTATAGSRWSIENGVLTPARGEARAYVVTKRRYADIEVSFEFNPDAKTNSGIFTRCQDPEAVNPEQCYEFNIWDAHPDQDNRTGAIVLRSPPVEIVDTEGKWNTMRVRIEGTRLRVWVNDVLTNDFDDDTLSEGHVAFQYGGENGMVVFRNIRIQELP